MGKYLSMTKRNLHGKLHLHPCKTPLQELEDTPGNQTRKPITDFIVRIIRSSSARIYFLYWLYCDVYRFG